MTTELFFLFRVEENLLEIGNPTKKIFSKFQYHMVMKLQVVNLLKTFFSVVFKDTLTSKS